MTDGVHVRLMVTRGVKSTPYQDPRVTVGPATVVIIAEHKEPMPATVTDGITLFTTHVRRATPDTLDPKLNAHSKLNDIQACIQAYTAGADEALMLDPHGFVATCNSTHFFIVTRTGEVWTSDGRFCLAGITRANVLRGLPRRTASRARETTFSLTDVYSAAEAFVTGTFAGVVPVRTVDGRTIGSGARGPVVERLQGLYQSTSPPTSPARPRRDRPGRDVVGSAQHLDGDDAVLGEPAGLGGRRRAVLRGVPPPHRARPPRPRRGDRLAADGPGRGGAAAAAPLPAAPCTTPST